MTAGGSVQAAPSTHAASPVTLQVWDWGSPPPKAMQVVIDSFEKSHPTIKIKIVHQPFNTVFTQLRAAIATRTGPDIFRSYASPFVFDFYRGLLPLNGLVTPADKKNLSAGRT